MIEKLIAIKNNLTASTIGVINIGEVHTFCLVYRVYNNNNYKFMAVESVLTKGFKGGAIVNLELANDCLSELLEKTEKKSRTRIIDTIITAPNHKTAVSIYPYEYSVNKIIEKEDIDILSDNITYENITLPDEIIVSIKYGDIFLDGQYVKDPIGLYASKIKTEITMVKCFDPYIVNLMKLLEHLEVNLVAVISPLLSLPYLTNTNSPAMSVFIDIDSKNTSLLVGNKSKISNHKTINYGLEIFLQKFLKN